MSIMSTHNFNFHGEIRKISELVLFSLKRALSGAMKCYAFYFIYIITVFTINIGTFYSLTRGSPLQNLPTDVLKTA